MALCCPSSRALFMHPTNVRGPSASCGSANTFCKAFLICSNNCRPKLSSPVSKLKPNRKDDGSISAQDPPDLPLGSPINLSELLRAARIAPLLIKGDENILITGIQHDSRLVHQGDLFVCCKGYTTDGHLHAVHAAQCGAVAVVATKPLPNLKDSLAFVQVEDTNAILSALSAAFYKHPSEKLTVVGITGTNGKTTTSYLVKGVFDAAAQKTGLLGTIAYDINAQKSILASNTTPDALSLQCLMATMVQNGATVCVMEVSSHALVLGRCNVVSFDIAVFTNLTRDHMDFHESEQHYKESKGLLFAKMVDPLKHRKVVNIDDPHAQYFIQQGSPNVPVVTYSLENREANVFASETKLSLCKTDIVVHTQVDQVRITSGLLGRHNVYNILAAVAVGVAANVPLEVIARGIGDIAAVPGRCELVDEGQSFAVLVDYAHTPDALSRLLDTVRECDAQRIITVVGCGGDRDTGKRPIMAKVATDKSNICILTSDNPRTENPWKYRKDMLAGIKHSVGEHLKDEEGEVHSLLDDERVLIVCENRSKAIRLALSTGQEGDAVVVAGKGHENYQIIGKRKEHFDDREECRRVLKQMGHGASDPSLTIS